jgi:predicted nucleic acid-binding protein
MKSMVLDGSMTLGFLLEDERFASAMNVLSELESGVPTYVPVLWWIETPNGLLMSERRKRISQAGVAKAIGSLRRLPVITDMLGVQERTDETLALARQHNLTIYDASYLELALRRDCALASADSALLRAAKVMGVHVIA